MTFTQSYCRIFRAFRAAIFAGYVPTPRERRLMRYLRRRVARRPVALPPSAGPAMVRARTACACHRAALLCTLARDSALRVS